MSNIEQKNIQYRRARSNPYKPFDIGHFLFGVQHFSIKVYCEIQNLNSKMSMLTLSLLPTSLPASF